MIAKPPHRLESMMLANGHYHCNRPVKNLVNSGLFSLRSFFYRKTAIHTSLADLLKASIFANLAMALTSNQLLNDFVFLIQLVNVKVV